MAEIFWSELTKIAVKMKQTHHPNSKMCWYQKWANDSRCQRAQMFRNLVPSWFKTTQKCIFRQISHTWHEFFKVYIYDFSSIFLNQNKGGCVIFENKSSEHLQLKSKGLFWKWNLMLSCHLLDARHSQSDFISKQKICFGILFENKKLF